MNRAPTGFGTLTVAVDTGIRAIDDVSACATQRAEDQNRVGEGMERRAFRLVSAIMLAKASVMAKLRASLLAGFIRNHA